MTSDDARALFSDYLEDALDDRTKDRLQVFLSENPECASELIRFERSMALLHRLPAHEPKLDLWREFAPKLAEYQKEQKQGFAPKMQRKWHQAVSQISIGLILYTHVLASRTHARLERYLLHDPLHQTPNREESTL